eukprot:TRINITY_DN27793_c0_g1_i1.p2 TRINITY_DN27793_c0_g1~~TRINITY_DN27793_c0_g1_i1.p2  ORF type:complete len:273 (-),score=51.57 TRINITY_DN27793_c0_g1_i1:72-890(-)
MLSRTGMMVSQCCCQDGDERHQVLCATPISEGALPTVDAWWVLKGKSSHAGDEALKECQWKVDKDPIITWPPQRQRATAKACTFGGQTKVMPLMRANSEDERLQEKERLRDLVKSFTWRAMRGDACEVVDALSGECLLARYFVEKDLARIVVRLDGSCRSSLAGSVAGSADSRSGISSCGSSASSSSTAAEVAAMRLVDIMDVATIEDGEAHFPERIMEAAHDFGRRARLCVLRPVRNSEGKALYLVLPTVELRDNFSTCMKILRLYCLADG